MTANRAAPGEPGLAVLVAEDNLVNQKVIVRLLRGLGCEVEAAATGQEVLAACAVRRFDLVLMDIRMPEMSGVEAARGLAQLLPPGSLPQIYAVTAGVDAESRQECLDAGMQGFLSKPVVLADLHALVERLLAARGDAGSEVLES